MVRLARVHRTWQGSLDNYDESNMASFQAIQHLLLRGFAEQGLSIFTVHDHLSVHLSRLTVLVSQDSKRVARA
jgi:hypothetical protein